MEQGKAKAGDVKGAYHSTASEVETRQKLDQLTKRHLCPERVLSALLEEEMRHEGEQRHVEGESQEETHPAPMNGR